MARALSARASDGTLLTVNNTANGTLLSASGTAKNGKLQELAISGQGLNQTLTFAEGGEVYLTCATALFSHFLIGGGNFPGADQLGWIASLSFQNAELELLYEVIPVDLATMMRPGDTRPFAVTKAALKPDGWMMQAAASGAYSLSTQTFPWLHPINDGAAANLIQWPL